MRLITWNLNHRTRERTLGKSFVAAIGAMAPDVLALTEYVPSALHHGDLAAIADTGLRHRLMSERVPGQNQVFVLSRCMLRQGPVRAPPIGGVFPSNFLHVVVDELSIEVLGVRIPSWPRRNDILRRQCWDWLVNLANDARSRHTVLLGDFNTDPRYPRAKGGGYFSALERSGWTVAFPSSGNSYWPANGGEPKQLDHAFLSPGLRLVSAEYHEGIHGGVPFGRQGAISDHAPLIIAVDVE